MVIRNFFSSVLVVLIALACNVQPTGGDTGGLGGDGGAGGDGGVDSCPSGLTVVLSDYISTQVALSDEQGETLSESVISSASSVTDGLAFALSGDVAVPSARAASGELVILDRFGTNVITWLSPKTGDVRAQLAVGTGFESNPTDYLEVSAGVAWVTRYGQNPAPGAEPNDAGGDILIIDTKTPKITGSIVLPQLDGLPARPGALFRLDDEVFTTLDRLSDDFSTMGEAMLVAYDARTGEETRRATLTGYKNCGRPALVPGKDQLAVACTGKIDFSGVAEDPGQSALLLLRTSDLSVASAFAASDLAGGPIQPDVAFATDEVVVLKTQSAWGGSEHNRWLSFNLSTEKTTLLLEAGADDEGNGKGLVFTGMTCLPGCSDLCLLADSDQGVLQRARIEGDGSLTLIEPVVVEESVGLPPIGVEQR